MKALKVGVVVAAMGFLLAGCGGGKEWEGEVTFKVTRLNPASESMGKTVPPYANLEIDQDEPGSVEPIGTRIADLDRLPEGVRVGDVVVCRVRQSDESGFDQEGVRTDVGPCRSR
ncbi:hypothetical protein FHS29_001139 [Saccharothrix tamanrassetensis]|uniref:Lipoprotein n=1 Tax=Saccharothrix tamanrassetensis TaxID=1051531 RepID=A0A841CAZ4_9PSEU|nr:hypothetical protein [Saccharothrix tamanrassetensis]MBB5954569.1 hypothetical protein [Saccharothrix tamanrassetensis]